jgi:hypothetical protein
MHMLAAAMRRISPDAAVAIANDPDELKPYLNDQTLLLINRVLDGSFHTDSGVELIRQIASNHNPPVMMLVSNFASAQEEAVEAGARPGFGKAQLYSENTAAIVRNAVAHQPI